jgi:hypothetical protein
MTQPPADPDEPLGGSLTPRPEDQPQGSGGFPPPPPPSGSFPPPTAYPTGQPVGFPPPPPGPYNPAFPPGPGTGYGQKPHRGTIVLVLGILGILCCFPLSFVAFVMARSDMAAMNAGTMDASGRQLTNIGRILGIVGIVYAIVQIIVIAMNWDTIMSDISTNSGS